MPTFNDISLSVGGVITENDIVHGFNSKRFVGRQVITTPITEITKDNIVQIFSSAQAIHKKNSAEIDYLYHVYCGWQDIQGKTKQARPETNNIVCVNRANEIVTFKTAYLLNEPIQYISHGGEDDVSKNVNLLNEYMRAEDKESKDKEIADWMHICGLGIRAVLPDPEHEQEGPPFYIATLDPRNAYVIYHAGIRKKALAGVINLKDENGEAFSYVYTRNTCYKIKDGKVESETPYPDLTRPPIVEYPANMPRLGAFEIVLSILNAINVLESNAVDNVQDFVNAFDVFQDCEVGNKYKELSSGGSAIEIKTNGAGVSGKVYRVTSEINQSGVQTRIDDLTDSYLTICGMPNRNGGSSTSDTGTAVIFRDGWSEAESRAKDTEKYFARSERDFLRLVLRICESTSDLSLKLSDIEINFARKSLSNIQSKIQSLIQMLDSPYIHNHSAFQVCGDIFGDAEKAYRMGQEWAAEQESKTEVALLAELNNARESAKTMSGNQAVSTGSEDNTGNDG